MKINAISYNPTSQSTLTSPLENTISSEIEEAIAHTPLSQPEITELNTYLKKVRLCMEESNFYVSTRDKNKELLDEFQLDTRMYQNIISNLTYKDFSKRAKNLNTKDNYKDEIVYIFGKEINLYDMDDEEHLVKLYIKLNLVQKSDANDFCIIVSLHKTSSIPKPLF